MYHFPIETAIFAKPSTLTLATISFLLVFAYGSLDEATALLKWKESLQDQNNNSVLSSWISFPPNSQNHSSTRIMPTMSPCTWYGVSCNSDGSLTKLNLSSLNLTGTLNSFSFSSFPNLSHFDLSANNFFEMIPPEISNLSNLVYLHLDTNQFSGIIPSEIGLLVNLEKLHLYENQLHGSIPHVICHMKFLSWLDLHANTLIDEIPLCLGNLTNLLTLDLYNNKLVGSIPNELENLVNLDSLQLHNNYLTGLIPNNLGNLSRLTVFSIFNNEIHGIIPPEIGSLSSLEWLNICTNKLTGSIPKSLGRLQSLTELCLYINNLSGPIPEELGNMTSMVIMQIDTNQFHGSIPKSFGNLSNLKSLHLENNQLSGSLPQELGYVQIMILEISDNNLSSLPDSICIGGNLGLLIARGNKLTGKMPKSLKNCSSLRRVRFDGGNKLTGNMSEIFGVYPYLEDIFLNDNKIYGQLSDNWSKSNKLRTIEFGGNSLSGSIPPFLGNCTQLAILNLSFNNLVGEIPNNFGRMNSIETLFVRNNKLSGALPLEVGSLTKLSVLDLSMNNLDGTIPYTLGKCENLNYLNLGSNNFTREIPKQLGTLTHLTTLDLGHNSLTSKIPSQIASMGSLERLNLSHNKLSGYIPKSMESMKSLLSIDISYNDLQGPIPNSNSFLNASIVQLQGNKGLCGNITGLQQCKNHLTKAGDNKDKPLKLTFIVSVFLGTLFLLLIFVRMIIFSCLKKEQSSSTEQLEDDNDLDFFSMLSFKGRETYDDILTATQEFNEDFCIGKGRFGSVYKAELPSDSVVAVKRLHPDSDMIDRNSFLNEVKALTKIRHRNIVNLYGYCSHGKDSLLVYEYLEGGDLFQFLRKEIARTLDWTKRVNIIKDVADALTYMHHDCSPPIVHRDISSKNILLNLEYEAYISDFGTSKILNLNTANETVVAGTFGYIAPEFAFTTKVTPKCDVYSFGILTLEVIKGLHPGDIISSLVSNKMELKDVVDYRLPFPSPEIETVLRHIIIWAVQCLNTNPEMRPTMYDVSQYIATLF